jgi:hypothetical protein
MVPHLFGRTAGREDCNAHGLEAPGKIVDTGFIGEADKSSFYLAHGSLSLSNS